MLRNTTPWVYPSLPGGPDFGLVRVAGAGLGNCFYAYFHAVVLAKQANARIIAPTWSSIKIGPLLRMERSLRRYGTMFRPHPDEVGGAMKAMRLLPLWPGHTSVRIGNGRPAAVAPQGLTIVQAEEFTFEGLHPHRTMVRERLLQILTSPPGAAPEWGRGDYAAAHIRLGDFLAARPEEVLSGRVANVRIPLTWYQRVIERVREMYPDLPIQIFSDGREQELNDILAIKGVTLRREPNDIGDLLALAQARLLIGSNSTFSRWAAFLGNMPSIWLKTEVLPEQPTSPPTPILYIADDCNAITPDSVAYR
jgi:Glycosyl transferase family 11